MSAEIAGFASKWRTQRRSRGEQRGHGTAGIARRPEPRLSFAQDVRMGRVSGKCRLIGVDENHTAGGCHVVSFVLTGEDKIR
jgi:hypothetical protein